MGKFIFLHLEVDSSVIFASMILEWEVTCMGNFNVFRIEKFWNCKFAVLAILNTWIFSLLVHFIYPYPHVEECWTINKFSYFNYCCNFRTKITKSGGYVVWKLPHFCVIGIALLFLFPCWLGCELPKHKN